MGWWWAALAYAETPVFVGADPAATTQLVVARPVATLGAEFGGSATGGNTSFYTLTSAVNGTYRWQQNKLGLVAAGVYGRGRVDADASGSLSPAEQDADPVETARRVSVDLRMDRFVSPMDAVYALTGVLVDPYAGYAQRTHEQVGYSRRLLARPDAQLAAELGFDYAQERYVSGVSPGYQDVFAVREMVTGQLGVAENLSLQAQVEVYENVLDVADVRVLHNAALVVKVSKTLQVKVGNTFVYDNVPVDGYGRFDQTTSATFVASLL